MADLIRWPFANCRTGKCDAERVDGRRLLPLERCAALPLI